MWQVGCLCPSEIRVPSIEVRKWINLYLTWTSVSTLELGLQRETAAFNLPLNYCNKTFQMPSSIFKQNSEKLLPLSTRNCLENKQTSVGCKTVAAT